MSRPEEGRARSGPTDAHEEAAPAHVHGRRGAPVRGRPDRRSLVTRLPVVVLLAAALGGAVAVDGARDAGGRSGTALSSGDARPESLMPVSSTSGTGSSTWYCAAGTAEEGGMADHTVTVLNAGDDALEATVTVFAGGMAEGSAAGVEPDDAGATTTTAETTTTTGPDPAAVAPPQPPEPLVERVDLPARERVDVRLGDLVEAPLAAALVEVDGGAVAVEHRVTGEHGADVAPCATFTAPTWHVAWGATTRDAREVVVLFNPFPTSATVDAAFTTEDGPREPVRFQGFPVPAGSVIGIDVGDDVTRSQQVSATFEVRSGRLVVEQLQQFDGSLGPQGLSLALGVPAPGETWVFADGEASAAAPAAPDPVAEGGDGADATETDATATDDDAEAADDELVTSERIVVYNPGAERAEVDVNVIPSADEPAPTPQPFGLSIGPGGYEVIDYGDQDRIQAGVPYTTVVRSTNGEAVVAERVTVDQGPASGARRSRDGEPPARTGEITAATGSRLAAPRWEFPSAADADDDSAVALVVFNPDPAAAVEVRIALLTGPSEAEALSPIRVAAGARMAIELDAHQAAAVRAVVLEAGGPVVVDRLVRSEDGRRRTMAPGLPNATGAVTLDDLADDGVLAGLRAP